MLGAIDLQFTEDARRRIEAFLGSITDYSPTLSLLEGATNDDPVERRMYGAYGPENIRALEPNLRELGKPLLYSIDGMTVAIPQFQFIHELEGKSLGLGVRGLAVLDRHDV